MSIEEKVGKTLAELGVTDAGGVAALFAEVRSAVAGEDAAAKDVDENTLRMFHDRWLARKGGALTQIGENWLKLARRDLIPIVGQEFNSLRADLVRVEKRLQSERTIRKAVAQYSGLADLTLPGLRRPLGSIHPITRVQREIEDIFLSLGFSIETGPEVETVYYNFDALNIPESHPARDDWDTIYVDAKTVLRTHTSPVQIRAMEKYGAPLYIIVPGKCYRHDNPDSSHSPMFHQIEGLAVDKDITFADLKGTLDLFAKKFFGESIRTNFFPSFFPFTEPSGDLAISCVICDGQGCRTCKESGWVEVMGCGMVHPDVLERVGLDPNRYSGWAFGLGLDRFAMMKYGINDIQLFFQSDLRFLEQF
jgi:phenylalanyl-tRNA synthetase alpha chain